MPINPDRILYCDDSLLAVNKLAGELVVAGAGKVDKLPLFDFLRKEYPGIHPMNRLDFETSGIVLFARTKKVLADSLSNKFRGWTKLYQTLVAGKIRENSGEISIPLPTRTKGEGNVHALTRYKVLERFTNSIFMEAEIATGRHHQIRRHFAMMKHPLVLDPVYGDEKYNRTFSKEFGFWRFFLHAGKVVLPHPVTGHELTIEAELPRQFEAVLEKLRAVK